MTGYGAPDLSKIPPFAWKPILITLLPTAGKVKHKQ